MTLNVINNASNIFIFCFGQKKREIIKEIISGEVIKEGLPIGYIKIHKENVFLFTDKESVDGYL